jgi:hypothetical protein
MEANYRRWNDQHNLLRQFLEKEKDYPKALELFLHHHAEIHTKELCLGEHWSFPSEVLEGLNDQQMRLILAKEEHSIVWLLWHIARIEDVTMNILLADSDQLFNTGDWKVKLASPFVNLGNEMTPEEICRLSESVDLNALMAYRLAVGKRTRDIVRSLDFSTLHRQPDPNRLARIAKEGAVGEKAAWLLDYWGGKPATNLLLMPASRHCFVHLNEIRYMLPKLKRIAG